MGEKAATNEVITKLVSALGDQSESCQTECMCQALGKMGEKAATNEVITKLLVMMHDNNDGVNLYAPLAVGNILSSSSAIKQLAPKIVADVCLCKYASYILKNISEEELINIFLFSRNFDWLLAVTLLTVLNGAALTVTENKVLVYGKTEPIELTLPNSELREGFVKAFIEQGKRLHLYFKIPVVTAAK